LLRRLPLWLLLCWHRWPGRIDERDRTAAESADHRKHNKREGEDTPTREAR
jgi:hypothetical protein